MRKMS